MKTIITNPNEITRVEFDQLIKAGDFDIFTGQQIGLMTKDIASLIKKGETNQLSDDETDLIKSGTAELKSLTRVIVNEMVEGRIVRTPLFIMPKQVKFIDTLQKSEHGENIVKGIYMDTPLNRELNRVGQELIKGGIKKADGEDQPEDDKPKVDSIEGKMAKAIMKCIRKSDGDDEAVQKEVEKAFPEATPEQVKKAIKKAYKAMADDFVKKAEEDEDNQ